jgi:hypothetical protein
MGALLPGWTLLRSPLFWSAYLGSVLASGAIEKMLALCTLVLQPYQLAAPLQEKLQVQFVLRHSGHRPTSDRLQAAQTGVVFLPKIGSCWLSHVQLDRV